MVEDSLKAEDVIGLVEAGWGEPCPDCAAAVCGHEIVMSLVLGFGDEPLCAGCLARRMAAEVEALRRLARGYVERRECFEAGWLAADRREAVAGRAPCRVVAVAPEIAAVAAAPATGPSDAARWDAGDMSCGDLVLQLRLRLAELEPGAVLRLTATDPAAPEDLPAWCGLTGHRLVGAHHPTYWIERRSDR